MYLAPQKTTEGMLAYKKSWNKGLIILLLALFSPIWVSANITLIAENQKLYVQAPHEGSAVLSIDGLDYPLDFVNNRAIWPLEIEKRNLHYVKIGDQSRLLQYVQVRGEEIQTRSIAPWLSILPPLLAIFLALVIKEVLTSLFFGTWIGAMILSGFQWYSLKGLILSMFEVISGYIITALSDPGHLSVIVFSLLIGGMVAIISKNGGMMGVVHRLARFGRSAQSSQWITWLLGVAIFFDDYANTLIVGNTMRPVTDKYKVSREKLAYIVDSTAAPIAAIAFITTWIGAELSYIQDGITAIGTIEATPYSIFVSSLRFSFYPVLALLFILLIIKTRKDFGPMYRAEKRARDTGQVKSSSQMASDEQDMEDLSPLANAPRRARNAVIPVMTVILVTIIGLVYTGFQNSGGLDQSISEIWTGLQGSSLFQKLGTLIGNSDSYQALLWSSFSGVVTAIVMSVGGKIMSLKDCMDYMVMGFKTMIPAVLILTLAWSLAEITGAMHTADFLSSITENALNPILLPAVIFVLAAFTSFATGSSWSTMAILYPIAIPLSWTICSANGMSVEESMPYLLNVIATVLAASVLGDHCSPISDTTILSSLASDCNHLDHVRTQLPYALTVGGVSLLLCTLSVALGGSWLVCMLLMITGLGILYLILVRFGKPVE